MHPLCPLPRPTRDGDDPTQAPAEPCATEGELLAIMLPGTSAADGRWNHVGDVPAWTVIVCATLGCFRNTQHPEQRAGKRVLSLDVGLLVAGAKERGELESRVTNILSECREAGNVILMCAASATSPAAASCRLNKAPERVHVLKPALCELQAAC